MDATALVPTPDTIPASWGVFEFLDIFTLIIHFLLINIVVGGTLLLFYQHFIRRTTPDDTTWFGPPFVKKIPSLIALGVTFGVAPLLFLQVLYGHLIYTSSILMALFWILIIPFLILAYYSAYIVARSKDRRSRISKIALVVMTLIVLYIPFMFVNNMTLMLQPERWTGYFDQRNGTLLNLSDPTVIPRYLHFLAASVAIAALFGAVYWWWKSRKDKSEAAAGHIQSGLRVFALATAVQMIAGFWLLLALPRDVTLLFTGDNMLYTGFLFIGVVLATLSLVFGLLGKLLPTFIHLFLTLVVMVVIRAFLRSAYLQSFFSVESLEVAPQTSVMILFFIVFVIGLFSVAYMLKLAFGNKQEEAAL